MATRCVDVSGQRHPIDPSALAECLDASESAPEVPSSPSEHRLDTFAVVVARQVAELLSERGLLDEAGAWIDAAEVARRHSVSRAWVYAHARELGAVRLGTGDRPRLRFDPAEVRRRLQAYVPSPLPPAAPLRTARGRGSRRSNTGLLPIKGGQQADRAA
jgi:hypothetical protein